MDDFKTRYNYIVFGLRFLFLLFFAGLFFGFLFKVTPSLWTGNQINWKAAIGLVAYLFISFWAVFHFGKVLLTERNIIIIQNGQLYLKDALTSKVVFVDKATLKGFSTSVYRTKINDFRTIIFYFNNGDKAEFKQFMYWNFKYIKPKLIELGISYLGHEPSRWKGFDGRHYLYDKNSS